MLTVASGWARRGPACFSSSRSSPWWPTSRSPSATRTRSRPRRPRCAAHDRVAPASRRPLLLAGAGGLLLITLTAAVLLRSGRPFPVDVAVHDWFVGVRTPALTGAERLLTATRIGVPVAA